MPTVTVVIPVLSDTDATRRLTAQIGVDPAVEVVIVDGGHDQRLAAIADARDRTRLIRTPPGRARQMNAGARIASGDWLLFLHADSSLPEGWQAALVGVDSRAVGGWFRFALDDTAWQARVLEQLVAWRVRHLRLPYGDQGLFVRRDVFHSLGGFREMPLLEDVEFVRRLVAAGPVAEVELALTTSARRWRHDGWLRRSARNAAIVSLYFAGVAPGTLARWYGHPQRE